MKTTLNSQFSIFNCLLLLATAPAFAQMTVCANQGYTLRSALGKGAAGIGDSPLTFTWYESVNNTTNEITNSNAESISIPEGRAAGTYEYTRWVANAECPGGVPTKPYTVLVHPLPEVAQSGASTFCDSGAHTLTVNASVDGDGVSVAWYTDSNPGSTVSNTTSCTVSASTVVGTYTYYVQATANTTQCKAAATVTATRALTEGTLDGWRIPGAIGETATFTDPRDSKQYKVVKMPDNRIWFAQNLNYQEGLTHQSNSDSPSTYSSSACTACIGSFWCPGAHEATTSTLAACDTYGALYTWETAMMLDGQYNSEDKTWDESWVSGYYYTEGAPGSTDNANKNNARGGRGICPPGWHVPTDYEWAAMLDKVEGNPGGAGAGTYVGTSTTFTDQTDTGWSGVDAGKHLKSAGTCTGNYCATDDNPAWENHDTNRGTDAYGFRVLPSGNRNYEGSSFDYRSTEADFWSSSVYSDQTDDSGPSAWYRYFDYQYARVYHDYYYRSFGYSVRCIKDSD